MSQNGDSSEATTLLEGVRCSYPDSRFQLAIDRLELARGERVACVGASGTGKTTLVELIAGIRLPDSGRVRVHGAEVSAMSEPARRAWRLAEVGLVFQEFELLEYLSGLDNVLLPYHLGQADAGLVLDDRARQRARTLAEEAGVAHTLERVPARLSQGERQRLAVCRALVAEPGLLLCDEGTGNLDPKTAGSTLDLLLEQAARQGATVFFVTHDHALLGRFDRVVDMEDLTA